MSAIKQFCFLITYGLAGVAFWVSFKNFSFSFTTWLLGARGLAFSLPWFWTCLPLRDTSLFLSLEHLEATMGLLMSPISVLLCLREQGGPRRRGGGEWSASGAVRAHAAFTSYVCRLCGCGLWQRRSPWQTARMETFGIWENYQMWHRDTKGANAVGKQRWKSCSVATNLSFVKNATSAKCNSEAQ